MKNLFLIAFLFSAFTVFGQYEGTVNRQGFVIGFGVGGGALYLIDGDTESPFEETYGAFSFPNLKIGAMLNERLALLATFPGMIYEKDGKDRSFEAFIPTLQYWMTDQWWVNGGAGLTMDFPAFYDLDDTGSEDYNFGCAVAFSTGYEIVQRNNFTIDLQSQVHMGRAFLEGDGYRDGVAFEIGVGFNWY